MGSSPEHCGFSSLPNELIHAITGQCRPEDILNLCQTSRRIHAICMGWIYRTIQLLDVVQVVKCCQTIIQSERAAESVRSFQIACFPRFGLKAFYSTIGCAASRLKNVRILRISDSRTIFRLFCNLHFPRLDECAIPSARSIVPFLQSNPTITVLHVLPCLEGLSSVHDLSAADAAFEFTSLLETIHLPNLEAFVGPINIACSVIPQSRTSRMTIYWGSDPIVPFSEGLAILARAKVDIIELNNLICHWDGALLPEIAAHIPRVQRLLFRNLIYYEDEEDFLSSIEQTLPSLHHLESLDLLEGFHDDSEADTLDDEFAIVRKWSSASPRLSHVGFPSNNTWGILCGAWFPGAATLGMIMFHSLKMDTRTMAHFKWFFRTITATPSLPQDYHLLAEFIAGKEGIGAVREAIADQGEVPDFVFTREDVNGSRIAFVADASSALETAP
ncbi:hypothetical protein MSAN_00217500 [Mycena sanguinolenta]|uniref:F-box domain-containing protein n=1 Tax=Mycena sanguinolenta TaxID=230812 RepID=A0A8H7DNS5_9AGAR|nr:hypothetical protein MSAN_00217500 [Mycena sanguinolenta]